MTSANVVAAWTQIAPGGTVVARAIARAECPPFLIDGKRVVFKERAAPGAHFDVRSCEAKIPASAQSVRVEGKVLPLPSAHLHKVAVLGDTGCRVDIVLFQACNDPVQWPFPTVAQTIARAKPDLIVHVGDYYYRETVCLVPQCSGSPHGDGWAAWNADYFAPAKPMFAVAPILAVRGNHETCRRGGLGWERFLSVFPYGICGSHETAYATTVGDQRFLVLYSSDADDDKPAQDLVPKFKADFAKLRAAGTSIVLTHRPMWAISSTITGATSRLNATLQAAEGSARGLPISLVLSGHVHLFEALSFADRRPPQVVVGTGGDTLNPLPARLDGEAVDGTSVTESTAWRDFGYAMFDLDAKKFTVYDRTGTPAYDCHYGTTSVTCRERR